MRKAWWQNRSRLQCLNILCLFCKFGCKKSEFSIVYKHLRKTWRLNRPWSQYWHIPCFYAPFRLHFDLVNYTFRSGHVPRFKLIGTGENVTACVQRFEFFAEKQIMRVLVPDATKMMLIRIDEVNIVCGTMETMIIRLYSSVGRACA